MSDQLSLERVREVVFVILTVIWLALLATLLYFDDKPTSAQHGDDDEIERGLFP